MRNLKSLCLLVFTSTLLIGCAGGESMRESGETANQEAVDSTPDWYTETPSDSDYLFATATATSRSHQVKFVV